MDELPSARQWIFDSSGWLGPTWLMIRQAEQLEEHEVLLRIQQDLQIKQVYTLAQQFIQIVKKREVLKLDQ